MDAEWRRSMGKKKGTSVIGSTIKINLKKREGDADLTPTIGKCVWGGGGAGLG